MGSHHKRHEGRPAKRTPAKPKIKRPTRESESQIECRAKQQAFLDRLASLFEEILAMKDYSQRLQLIKGHFYRREYDKVFQDPLLCAVYAVRYLPSRALAYANLFSTLTFDEPCQLTAIGAGVGSELCAFDLIPKIEGLSIDIVDYAEYEDFLKRFDRRHTYHKQDILQWSESEDWHALLSRTTLLTFMFVFNELFASSKTLTMRLIASVAKYLPSGSSVLLVESAGDLSEVQVADSTMMVYRFWDFLPSFEKVISIDRTWYRVDPALQYPLELENVGYFTRLYRKL